ncbi:MAG: lipoyl(octanoyl) transferase LipB [Chloroflexi bacterium]|nr:MAG: lipoyl(octanoyl) transferase LipB [Chloroflexota bacterium]
MTGQSDLPPLRQLCLGTVPYRDAWRLQRVIAAQRVSGEVEDDVLILLEHPPVYTMGRTGDERHLGGGRESLIAAGADYIDVDRGGSVTFHGPGQLVAYPIVKLASVFPIQGAPDRGDVMRYVRALEEAVIATAAAFGVAVARRPPYTGVWSGNRKLAAIGVKLATGMTTHGLALNVCTDLSWFDRVVPCGIDGAEVTSLTDLSSVELCTEEVAPVLAAELARVLGRRLAAPRRDSRYELPLELPAAV